jgi:hypothetical protein
VTRISLEAIARAIRAVEAMNLRQKEALTDEIFLAQPHMLGSVLVLPKLGVSMEKTEFAIELLLLCFSGDEGVRPDVAADHRRRSGIAAADLRDHRQAGRRSEAAAAGSSHAAIHGKPS